ncbi:hypothetical protein AB4Z39_04940 [Mycobacterium adipatum]|uniref:hypothetical protein n=1 Tax=Mycobacterium adipatum TaxID=1682113 RepID=UPI0034E092A2
MADAEEARPPREHRLLSDRSEPAVIAIRTHFVYHAPSGQPARVARYHSDITDSGEFGTRTTEYNHVGDVIQRMIAAFGDDADLEVVIRRAAPITAVNDSAAQQNR